MGGYLRFGAGLLPFLIQIQITHVTTIEKHLKLSNAIDNIKVKRVKNGINSTTSDNCYTMTKNEILESNKIEAGDDD